MNAKHILHLLAIVIGTMPFSFVTADEEVSSDTSATVELTQFLGSSDNSAEVDLDDIDIDDVQQVQFQQPGNPVVVQQPQTVGQTIGFRLTEPFGPLFRLGIHSGRGPGFDADAVSADVFVPIHTDPGTGMFFWNFRGTSIDDGDFLGNLGFGYRRYNALSDRVFGVSGWLDVEGDYSRLGVSFETLGRFIDLRSNFTQVLGDPQNIASGVTGGTTLQGNSLLLDGFLTRQFPLSYSNVEVGGYLPFFGRYGINGYVGAHFLRSDLDDAIGLDARLEALLTDNTTINIHYSDNDLTGSTTWASVVFTYPPGLPTQLLKAKTGRQRFADPVQRVHRIQRVSRTFTTQLAATRGGAALNILHVNPDLATNGTGTFENPFNSLEAARLANNAGVSTIYVQNRDDGSATNLGMNGTLNLFANQQLLGATIDQVLNTDQGNVTLLAQETGANPLINNLAGGNVVNLATGSQVSGFTIDGSGSGTATGSAIFGAGVSNYLVSNNTLQNALIGLNLQNPGTGSVRNNIFNNNTNSGMQVVTNPGSVLEMSVIGNSATNNGGFGFNFLNNGGTLNLNNAANLSQFTNNTATGNLIGAQFRATGGGTTNVVAVANTFSNNLGVGPSGVNFQADGGGTVNVQGFSQNRAENNIGNGVNVAAGLPGTGNGTVNVVTATGANGFFNNIVNGNGDTGVNLQTLTQGSTINAKIGSATTGANDISGNNFGVRVNNIGTTTAIIQANQIGSTGNGNAAAGVNITNDRTVAGPDNLNVLVGGATAADGNSFSDNGSGIVANFTSSSGGVSNPFVLIRNNLINNSGTAGVTAVSNSNVNASVTIDQNTITGTGTAGAATPGSGINVQGNNTSSSTYNITNNLIDSSVNAVGISTLATDSSTFTANITDNVVQNGTGDGILLQSTANAAETVNVNGNTVFNQTGDGLQINIDDNSRPTYNIGTTSRNTFAFNTGLGINLLSGANTDTTLRANSSQADININNNLLNNNGGGGMSFVYTNGNTNLIHDVDITFNELINNTGTGINIDLQGVMGTRVVGQLNDFNISGNTLDGHTDGIIISLDALVNQNRTFGFANGPIINPGNIDSTPIGGINADDDNVFLGDFAIIGGLDVPNYRENFQNTATLTNALITITGNQIRNSTNDGLNARISTGSYLALDVQNNLFTNSGGDDIQVDSFLTGTINNSVNNSGLGTFDNIVLDDTAQLSMRLLGNSGSSINIAATGATYTNADPRKGGGRNASLFHITQGSVLTAQNSFIGPLGQAQDVDEAFRSGGFFIDQRASYELLDFNFGASTLSNTPFEDDFNSGNFIDGVNEFLED